MLKAMVVTNRGCYAGYTVSPTGEAYDFQGLCIPGANTGQSSSRMCEAPYYSHGPGQPWYDIKGFCDPTKSPWQPAAQTGIGDMGGLIGKVLLWGGLAYGAYYLWQHKDQVKGWFS